MTPQELELDRWHRAYQARGQAWVARCHPEWNTKERRFVAKGPPDFVGILAPSGRGVVFDAKETSKSAFPFANIKPHQAVALSVAQRMGAIAFLAVKHKPTRRHWVLPWYVIEAEYNEHPSGSWDFEDGSLPMLEDGWIQYTASWPWPNVRGSSGGGEGGAPARPAEPGPPAASTSDPLCCSLRGDGNASPPPARPAETRSPLLLPTSTVETTGLGAASLSRPRHGLTVLRSMVHASNLARQRTSPPIG